MITKHDQLEIVDTMQELDELLADAVVFLHYQQYRDVCNIMAFQNHSRVYRDLMLEQGTQLDIDDHAMLYCLVSYYIVIHRRFHFYH